MTKTFLEFFDLKEISSSFVYEYEIIKYHKTKNQHFGFMIKILSLEGIEKFKHN
jgi:hypothetical protein